ncbi:MAG: NUDIX domain-containing protein [Candidatus Latescibacteria bacterium]|nr:NUDIX domain-containing protein [Candidatus Latescibacterota bacterium]MDP7450386.1 NUDIX domain-containing protein [Candidatus Latescibacterota bacterium]HJP33298.1 NUDIX domain-containing protein [Candidatus Latescibacterota bacterium]
MADDELLDVLDADDLHVVGRKTREDVHRDHDWHGTVFVWSAWESADVRLMLLQQRGRVGDPYAQMVDALAGGHIGAGETAIDGARRELTEEVGLAAEADNFIHLGSSRMERPDGECRRVYQSLLLYPLPLDIGGMQFSDEVDGFVEVDLDGFSDLVHGRCEHLPARARLAHDGGHLRQIDLQRRAVLGYPDEIVDTFRRSLASISSWLRHGAVDSVHFE